MKSGMYRNIMEQYGVLCTLVEGGGSALERFAKDVRCKQRIFLIGTGASLNAALACTAAFAKYAGIVPTVLPASEVEHYTHLFGADSAVVLISQSGDSFETKMMCQLMNRKGLPFWGITNEVCSTLAKQAENVLLMRAGTEVSSATKTQTATMLLLFLVAAHGSQQGMQALAGLPARVQETISGCEARVADAAALLAKERVLYVLSDNLSGASARQGALMLKEKDFIMAEGMTASEFRHGAVEVVEKGLAVVYLAPCSANRAETQKHITFLTTVGCKLVVVSPEPFEDMNGCCYIPMAACDEDVFSNICATIPMQLLAERIADQNGYDVDGFRYLSKVVSQY